MPDHVNWLEPSSAVAAFALLLAALPAQQRLPTAADDPATAALRAVAFRVNIWLAARTRVSPDGSFNVPFVEVPGSKFEGWVRCGDRSARLVLAGSAEPVEFDLGAK